MSHIYTKSGDKGETGLLGGSRVSKHSLRISAIGEVDELNAAIGVLRTYTKSKNTHDILRQAQDDIFVIGAELADLQNNIRHTRLTKIFLNEKNVHALEKYIDDVEEKLPPLKNFILPGGTPFAAHAHLARALCRRSERALVALHEKEPTNQHLIVYLNRLSDLLFMLAREDMAAHKKNDILWKA